MTGPLLYLTGEYPRATDTFIQREVAALRAQGITIMTASIRRTGPEHLVGEEQIAEAAQTFHVLEAAKHPLRLAAAKLRLLRHPGRFFRAFALVWRTAPGGLRNWLWQMFYFAEAIVLADHMQRHGVRHLHNHIAKASCTVAMLASALSGIPYSFTIHGPDIFFEPQHWRIDEKAARAEFVACISAFCRSQLMCFAEAAHWPKLRVVHCGIDPARYAAAPGHDPVLLFVGRLAGVKGVPLLLEALAALAPAHPALRLRLIGDGPDRAALEARAIRLGLADRVEFLGYRSQSEVADALAGAQIFVLPSFAEGVPVVLMEAMAAGLPVVTTQIAGIPELVDSGISGLLVPPGEAAPLARALDTLLTDPARRHAMGQAGRARVSADFNIATEAAKLSQLFQSSGAATPAPLSRKDIA